MINTTDRPIILKSGSELDSNIREAMNWSEALLRKQQIDTKVRATIREAFTKFLGNENRRARRFDETFIQAAFDFASRDAVSIAMNAMARYVFKRTVAVTGFALVKRGVKLTLVELWRRGVLVLPTVFTLGPHFAMAAFDQELLRWLLSFDPNTSLGKYKTDTRRLYYYGPRLILATDWSCVEDVSINDIAELHLAQLHHSKGMHPYAIAGSAFPWSQLPAELLKHFPDRVSFDHSDLVKYSAWAAKQAVNREALEAFIVHEKRAKNPAPRPSRLPMRPRAIPKSKQILVDFAAEAKNASTHDAVLALFGRLAKRRPKSADWREQIPTYPGREHVDVGPIARLWVHSFKAFLHHRELFQGFRSASEVIASINILADYLFLYLPWWRELFPKPAVAVPISPKTFARYAFVSRHGEEAINVLPVTLLTLLKLRRPTAQSAAVCIRHWTLYFRFVGTQFNDDNEIAGATFKNPLDAEFDLPRIARKSKTNKEIIPRNIYGHLLFYCYGVEEFGQYLLQQALEGKYENNWIDMRSAPRYDTTAFGMTPIVHYRGEKMPLPSVPNVFSWVGREVVRGNTKAFVVVPHLTALRLLIASLETGLRCQSIQWLDRTTWDSLNEGIEEQYVYRLLVNTDKTKVEAWTAAIVFRVRHVMKREVTFQELFADFASFEPVQYEGLKRSPFEPIRPLFKSPNTGRPIRDDVYSDAWLSLMVDFEDFYRRVSGERHVRMYYLKSLMTSDGQPEIRYTGRDENAYCGISILPVHTPHSCRSTFATNRQGQGILELSDVAELLGQEDIATTALYTKFSAEQLQERLQQSDAALLGDYTRFEVGAESAYLRPDKPDSALVRSFSMDREGTVASFGFMPSIALWFIEDAKLEEHDGLSLLRSGPMSHIRFRETHICPVGEECPADIVRYIGAPKRCGRCPLAMKCIDHLPAIAAKQNQLIERSRYLHAQSKRMEAAGEPSASLDAIWDEMQLDNNELIGWKLSEEVLQEMHAKARDNVDATSFFHVDRPDIVRRHLQLVTRQCDRTEFLLQRLAESNAYPSMTSPQVELAASVLRRRFSAGQGLEALATFTEKNDDVRDAASALRTMMKASGLSMKEVASLLTSPVQFTASEPCLLHNEAKDGE